MNLEMTTHDKTILKILITFGLLPLNHWDRTATAIISFNGVPQISIINKYRQN